MLPTQPSAAAETLGEFRWAEFERLQTQLPPLFRHVFADPAAPRCVVVVPGLSLDPEVLAKVSGARFYEERMLSMLMLLRFPNTKLVFVTSSPIDPAIVDYYLGLLPGVPGAHARKRLVMLNAHDASSMSLSEKILRRPRLLARIRQAIDDRTNAHLSVFNATELEARLACLLGIPMYACDPRLAYWGSKSGSRESFRRAGVALPDGEERLRDRQDVLQALLALRQRNPDLRRAVVKLEEGFSGDGNARIELDRLPATAGDGALESLREALEPEAADMQADEFLDKFDQLGGIVEVWLEGDRIHSPSVQVRINPLREIELISTHDQVLGGRSGQVFLGSRFPADRRYRAELHASALKVAAVLRDQGVLGRFSIDFLHRQNGNDQQLFAIETNLRKGGTTLPFQMLQFLTAGSYQPEAGEFVTPLGQTRCYVASDNLQEASYRRLGPEDLIDVLVQHRLHFDNTRQRGVVFNLIGALSEFGKLGLVSIADSMELAQQQYDEVVNVLDRETAAG
ncbi:carboxylate-amine ligase [Pseudoxanthomonas sp. CAU 1598]|uniref:Carboxylate-amine ligase n=2 Tax=Pseudomarimonas arenosa TaxID=2774145 RepID=A0AAW3ZPL0_9GAMM|nr:carboxylate-amine ligase [Pseudomarimonas arenosa]